MKENNYPEESDFLEELPLQDEAFEGEETALPEDFLFEDALAGEDAGYAAADAEEEFSIHDLLTDPETGEELAPDDHAMYAAGLVHPEDAEYLYEDAADPIPEEAPQEPYHDTEYRDPEYQSGSEEGLGEFDVPLDDEETESPARRRERPAHKGRPKRKKGYGLLGIPHMIATVIWLVIIVAIGVSLGRMLWVCAADVLAFGREEQTVTVTITSDDTIEDIADKLHEAGLVRYPELFKLYADLAVDEGEITTGTFTLNTLYDYHALVNGMSPSSSSRKVVEGVLIPEGFSCSQIFARLEEKGVCKAAELEEYAANGELDEYWFLEGLERGDKYCLEGFLFPATYDFYENSTPRQVLEKMLDAFQYNFTEELQGQIETLNVYLSEKLRANGYDEDYIAANQMDLRKLITVASLIEKEMAHEDESPKIASVIYNRLTNQKEYPYLNIDAAIFYALGEHKEALTAEDLQIDSPYNTYKYPGLVPGPIANPGIASIKAALNPEDTAYYYYILDPEAGEHDFSKTLDEHEKKRAEYYGG